MLLFAVLVKFLYLFYFFFNTSYNFTHREMKDNSIKPKNKLGSAKKFIVSLPGFHQLGSSALGLTSLRATSTPYKDEQVYMRMVKRSVFSVFAKILSGAVITGNKLFWAISHSLLIPYLCYLQIWRGNVQIHTLLYMYFFQVCSLYSLNYLILKDLLEIQ